MKIIVYGGYGSVGTGIVKNLVRMGERDLVIAGRNLEKGNALIRSLECSGISFRQVDLNADIDPLQQMRGCSIVVNATYPEYNLKLMHAALQAGCHYLDLGGMFHTTQKQLELDQDFSKSGLTSVLCMGACPGMSNVFAAHGARRLDQVTQINIRVGSKRGKDFQGFNMAPQTLIAEFTRNPYVYEGGKWKEMSPLSGRERYRLLDPVGEVEGFYCIHSEVLTLPMSFCGIGRVTYQVSFPSSIMSIMDTLMGLKLLSSTPFMIQGVQIAPRRFLEEYLSSKVKAVTGYLQEHKALQVDVHGVHNGEKRAFRYETVVGSNRELNLLGSAYWTSVPNAIVVRMLRQGAIQNHGVIPPERAVNSIAFLNELSKYGIMVRESEML